MSTLKLLYGKNYLVLSEAEDSGEALLSIITQLQNHIVALEQGRKTKKGSQTIHNLRVTLSALHCFGAFHLGLQRFEMCLHNRAQENEENGFHICEDCHLD